MIESNDSGVFSRLKEVGAGDACVRLAHIVRGRDSSCAWTEDNSVPAFGFEREDFGSDRVDRSRTEFLVVRIRHSPATDYIDGFLVANGLGCVSFRGDRPAQLPRPMWRKSLRSSNNSSGCSACRGISNVCEKRSDLSIIEFHANIPCFTLRHRRLLLT